MQYIIAILILLVLSAFFSAAETAFTSVNRIRMKAMAGEGDKKAKRVLKLIDDYDRLLTSIIIGNNIVNMTMATLATVFFLKIYPEHGATAATVVITVAVVIFGEISPKSVAKEKAEQFAIFAMPVMEVINIILTPINWIFGKWKKLLARVFRIRTSQSISDDELRTMVEEAHTEGSIDSDQRELIENAIEFDELEAQDVMTTQVDISAIDVNQSREEIAAVFRETGFTRIPVYENDLDNIVGVLNQKDFHNYLSGSDTPVMDYVKPVVFVSPTMKISLLLKKMQAAKSHIAIVIDEYGCTFGLVTMEDIIEELVGEIYDEYDKEEDQEIVQLSDGRYRVKCSFNLEQMFDFFDVRAEVDATTVNGWVLLQLDRLPVTGDTFVYEADGHRFDVLVTKADAKKAIEINMTVTRLQDEEE